MSAPRESNPGRARRLDWLESQLRAQYSAAIVCIVILAATGLPQKFESLSLCRKMMDLSGGIETVQLVHRVAGGALVLTGVYHVVLVLVAALTLGELAPLRMIPTLADFRDAARATAHFLGLTDEAPAARRARYLEKVDYWFMAWSLGLMAATGLVNLMPFRAARLISADNVLAALRTHSDAAPLVVIWVATVHLVYTGLTPRLFRASILDSDVTGPAIPAHSTPVPATGDGLQGGIIAASTADRTGREPAEDWEAP